MGREGLLLFIWSIICPEANSKVKRESVPLPSGTGLLPVARGSIPDKVFELGALQVAWHHLALSKRSKCGGVAYLAAEFHAGDRSLQVVWVREEICLDLNAARVQSEPKHVDWWPQQLWIGSRDQWRSGSVGCDQCPMAINRQSRIRFMAKVGAYPAATIRTFRSRKGILSRSARCRIMARLGNERPVSRKLRCLVEISASQASASWLRRRRWRHSRRRWPTGRIVFTMSRILAQAGKSLHYL